MGFKRTPRRFWPWTAGTRWREVGESCRPGWGGGGVQQQWTGLDFWTMTYTMSWLNGNTATCWYFSNGHLQQKAFSPIEHNAKKQQKNKNFLHSWQNDSYLKLVHRKFYYKFFTDGLLVFQKLYKGKKINRKSFFPSVASHNRIVCVSTRSDWLRLDVSISDFLQQGAHNSGTCELLFNWLRLWGHPSGCHQGEGDVTPQFFSFVDEGGGRSDGVGVLQQFQFHYWHRCLFVTSLLSFSRCLCYRSTYA